MTYWQTPRDQLDPQLWTRASMAPPRNSIPALTIDVVVPLPSYRRTRLPVRQIPGFILLWTLQRLAYESGWNSPRQSDRVSAN
jgi:hypothetical protein